MNFLRIQDKFPPVLFSQSRGESVGVAPVINFREHVTHFIYNAYECDHTKIYGGDGTVSTSLVEDVMSLVHAMADILLKYLLESNDAFAECREKIYVDGIQHILVTLERNQRRRSMWRLSLSDLEDSCATMNDFVRISEAMELFLSESFPKMMKKLHGMSSNGHKVSVENIKDVHEYGMNLVTLYSQDAVVLAEHISVLLIRDIQKNTTIVSDFFSILWETEWTNNDVCRSMIHIVNDYLVRSKHYLIGRHCGIDRNTNTYLYHKVIISTVRSVACFYVRCLIRNKAEQIALRNGGGRNVYFKNPKRALRRMYDDIRIIQKYFTAMSRDSVTLHRIVVDDLSILELVYECLLCCHAENCEAPNSKHPSSSLESFIVVIHKRCSNGNPMITKYFMGDLYFLMTSVLSDRGLFGHRHHVQRERVNSIRTALEQLQPDLQLVSNGMKEVQDAYSANERTISNTKKSHSSNETMVAFNRFDVMLLAIYEDRITQGILPPFCTAMCLSHGGNDEDDKDLREIIAEVLSFPIRKLAGKFMH
jgi:hypothetical protein